MKSFFLSLICLVSTWMATAQQAPGDNVTSLRGRIGETFTFTTTGTTEGSVWGGENGIYTDDSRLGKAAVHAGLLRPGETGAVTITILEGRASYIGSSRNGVTTSGYGNWNGSFQFKSGPKKNNDPVVSDGPANMTEYRGNNGSVYSFRVTGTTDGSVWGGANGIYTDDSKLSTAAVHAGLLSPGQSGIIQVTIREGQSSYSGNLQHGIKSNDYGAWKGSYVLGNTGQTNVQNIANAPDNMTQYRGNNGRLYSFRVTGTNSGSVWGGANGIYTDDSHLGAAAVQAGLVRVGETAVIHIRVLEGQSSYQGTNRNGIISKDYAAWSGSYKFE